MTEIKIIVSEWGFITEFDSLVDAINYCVENKLTDGEEGMIWIESNDRQSLDKLIEDRLIDFGYMRLKHSDSPNNWIYDSVYEEWEDATEIEQAGEEDFEQMYEVRKEYIEDKYGEDHGKTIK